MITYQDSSNFHLCWSSIANRFGLHDKCLFCQTEESLHWPIFAFYPRHNRISWWKEMRFVANHYISMAASAIRSTPTSFGSICKMKILEGVNEFSGHLFPREPLPLQLANQELWIVSSHWIVTKDSLAIAHNSTWVNCLPRCKPWFLSSLLNRNCTRNETRKPNLTLPTLWKEVISNFCWLNNYQFSFLKWHKCFCLQSIDLYFELDRCQMTKRITYC